MPPCNASANVEREPWEGSRRPVGSPFSLFSGPDTIAVGIVKKVYRFSDRPLPLVSEVGGKGLSLMSLFQAGFPVPNGFILSPEFFSTWSERVKAAPAWKEFAAGDPAVCQSVCRQLKNDAQSFVCSADQKATLTDELHHLEKNACLAVRSSAPEEDQALSSFAGLYRTILGVLSGEIETALRSVSTACLDPRVVAYKRARGFDHTQLHCAIVVQEQLAGDVSGVGFSVNPLTHNVDEVVFEANWGLGETVVSGAVSPDRFVVNKPTRTIVSRRLGHKESSVVLGESGGTRQWEDPRHDVMSLTDGQLQALTEAAIAIERHYAGPMDIEWTFSGGRLYLLQARPITTNAHVS